MPRQQPRHTTEPTAKRGELTVGVVDDEPLSRRGMHLLVDATPGFHVVGEAASGIEALALIRQRVPDIVLLDVQMPGFDGFEVLRRLRGDPRPTIIFVTAHDEYALRAFEVHAVDYLLKPYTDERFREALQVARRIHRSRAHADHLSRLESLVRSLEAQQSRHGEEEARNAIAIRGRGRIELVALSDVAWIEAEGNYVRLHAGSRSWLHRESLSRLATRLDPTAFVRAHRSAIVACAAIRQVIRARSGAHDLILTTGDRVRTSRQGWRAIRVVIGEPA